LAAGVFLLTARRSQAILAIALVACLIPVAQRVVVAGLDFNMIRILILFGWVRLLSRNEMRGLRMNEIDVAFVTLRFAGGQTAHLWMSVVPRLVAPRYRAVGLRGVYEKDGVDPQEDALRLGGHPGEKVGRASRRERHDDGNVVGWITLRGCARRAADCASWRRSPGGVWPIDRQTSCGARLAP
jgi:hypothetical protein